MGDTEYYRDLVSATIGGKPWIVAVDVLVPAVRFAAEMLELGASRVFALGAGRGAGVLPDRDDIAMLALDNRGPDVMAAIRSGLDLLADLPPHARAALDAFDPDRAARVIGAPFCDDRTVGDRRIYGARSAAWRALEDKVRIDAFWDAVGIPRAPSLVVAPEVGALRGAAAAVDVGAGAVFAADDRGGFNGAAWGVRWVRTEADLIDAAEFYGPRCDRVRVMPFLDGIPCSIHGIVLPDEVLAVRPCEMLVLRRPGSSRFHYARASTFWDPPDADRAAMRALARRAGAALRERVGYRGVFTIDGVMTADGFLPTELNPRFGAALHVLAEGATGLPLYLLHLAIAEGEDLDWRGADLEALLVGSGDRERRGGGGAMLDKVVDENVSRGLVLEPDGWRFAEGEEPTDAVAGVGPGPTGGLARVSLDSSRTPRGPSSAPRVASALAFLDRELDLGIGALEAAPDLRR